MKRTILSLLIAMLAIVGAKAQQIAVVSSQGSTKMYQTLAEAIEGATDGSTVYLPGGGFQTENVSIKKKLTIVGIGHKPNGENADGNTTISGNVYFDEGSSGSAIMGCYISDQILIGYNPSGSGVNNVNNILVSHCNIYRIQVSNSLSTGIIINQNYVRYGVFCGNAPVELSNNVLNMIYYIEGGIIKNNTIVYTGSTVLYNVKSSTISNNVFCRNSFSEYTNSIWSENIIPGNWGGDNIDIGTTNWNDVFVNWNNGDVSPASDFHFKDEYKQYESKCGIYAGGKFEESGMAPVPYIVEKEIPEHTDAEGKLNIKIRVKASE